MIRGKFKPSDISCRNESCNTNCRSSVGISKRIICFYLAICHAQGSVTGYSDALIHSIVIVLTTVAAGSPPRGTTCSSFTSVSLEPPIVSVALRSPSQTITLLNQSRSFAIHFLSHRMLAHSIAFSNPKSQSDFSPFKCSLIQTEHGALPILKGCLAVLMCSTERQISVGDHDVFFGNVKSVIKEPEGDLNEPLLYYKSSYRSVGDEIFMEAFESGALSPWTHREHIRMAWNYIRQVQGSYSLALPMIRCVVFTKG